MNKPMSPCKDCSKRTEACHDACEEYRSFKENLEEYKEKYRKMRTYSFYRAERQKEYQKKKR